MSLDKNRLTLCRAGTDVVMTRFTNHSIFWVSLQGKIMKYEIQRNQLTLSVVADNLIEGGDPMGSVWQRAGRGNPMVGGLEEHSPPHPPRAGNCKLEGGWKGNPRPICQRIVIRNRPTVTDLFGNDKMQFK